MQAFHAGDYWFVILLVLLQAKHSSAIIHDFTYRLGVGLLLVSFQFILLQHLLLIAPRSAHHIILRVQVHFQVHDGVFNSESLAAATCKRSKNSCSRFAIKKATCSVSILGPAPVYYADLVCCLGVFYEYNCLGLFNSVSTIYTKPHRLEVLSSANQLLVQTFTYWIPYDGPGYLPWLVLFDWTGKL